MKKLLSFTAIAALAAMVSCGPSQEEIDAKAKLAKDSIAADSTKAADRAAFVTDSTNKANEAAAAETAAKMADSLHKDSVAKWPKLFPKAK